MMEIRGLRFTFVVPSWEFREEAFSYFVFIHTLIKTDIAVK
jgi:hypothetical protein